MMEVVDDREIDVATLPKPPTGATPGLREKSICPDFLTASPPLGASSIALTVPGAEAPGWRYVVPVGDSLLELCYPCFSNVALTPAASGICPAITLERGSSSFAR